jgi:hypothetical protein
MANNIMENAFFLSEPIKALVIMDNRPSVAAFAILECYGINNDLFYKIIGLI